MRYACVYTATRSTVFIDGCVFRGPSVVPLGHREFGMIHAVTYYRYDISLCPGSSPEAPIDLAVSILIFLMSQKESACLNVLVERLRTLDDVPQAPTCETQRVGRSLSELQAFVPT